MVKVESFEEDLEEKEIDADEDFEDQIDEGESLVDY